MNPIVVVGAGVTGCVIANGLAKKGYKVLLIEKESKPGGLAKTFRYDGYSFDIGPHRFFTNKERISEFIKKTLKDDYNIISRHSEVYFLGKYYCWPLRPTVAFKLPVALSFKSAWDLILMQIRQNIKHADTFEDYILKNYGPSLYNAFFKGYTEKFLGYPPSDIHSRWAKESIQRTIIDERMASRNLFDILKLFFVFKPLKTEFIYPAQGTDIFCTRLISEMTHYDTDILMDSSIKYLSTSENRIDEVYVNNESIKPEKVIWTGPLYRICNLLDVPYDGLEYLSLVVFNIELKNTIKKDFQWCYYGDKDIVFSRVTIPRVFSKALIPDGKSSLCVEITCRTYDDMWNNPERYTGKVKNDLLKVDLIKKVDEIGNIHIEKIINAYPIYKVDYAQKLKTAMNNLDRFENLQLAGRTALFWYNNMDDSIENGLNILENITKRENESITVGK